MSLWGPTRGVAGPPVGPRFPGRKRRSGIRRPSGARSGDAPVLRRITGSVGPGDVPPPRVPPTPLKGVPAPGEGGRADRFAPRCPRGRRRMQGPPPRWCEGGPWNRLPAVAAGEARDAPGGGRTRTSPCANPGAGLSITLLEDILMPLRHRGQSGAIPLPANPRGHPDRPPVASTTPDRGAPGHGAGGWPPIRGRSTVPEGPSIPRIRNQRVG